MKRIALLYLLAITIAEVVTVNVNLIGGVSGYIVIFAALVLHAALTHETAGHQLLVSLTLVPLIRIISLSLPLASIPSIWWYPIVYAPLLATSWFIIRTLGYKWSEIGLQVKRVSPQLLIASSGFIFGLLEYFILREEAELTGLLMQKTWFLSALILMMTTGFVEELIFRGVLQRSAEQALGRWGIVYTGLLFAIVHWIHGSLLDIAFVFVVALFFGWMVKKTGSLLGVTLSHGIANIILFLVAPLLF